MSVTGGRSKETPRYLRGMTALTAAARAGARRAPGGSGTALRDARGLVDRAKPLPSQLAEGARCRRRSCGALEPAGSAGTRSGRSGARRPRPPLRCLAMMSSASPGLVGGLGVVVLVAVDEHHEVGVLLDLAGLAQVGEHRALVGPRLDAARELARARSPARSSSRARIFSPRLISPTCWTRFSMRASARISCR